MAISKLAYVHPDAQIGKGVTIEAFAYVAGDVVIGDGTWVGPHGVILDGARVGRCCKIHSGAVVAGVPQDLKFKGEYTTAEIGDGTMIRESATVNRATQSKGKTIVGKNCLIMAYSHVAHDCLLGDSVILGNATQLAGEVEVDDYAILSGGCLVHQFSRIGKHAMVQGGSKVTKDVPPYAMAGREPLVYSGLNRVGLKRRGFSAEAMEQLQKVYYLIYGAGYNVSQGIAQIETTVAPSVERDEVVNFIKSSTRGVIRALNME